MSVYGSSHLSHPLNECDLTAPDEPYGAAKRAVELVGESLAAATGFGFVALRIARVVGPGGLIPLISWTVTVLESGLAFGLIAASIRAGSRSRAACCSCSSRSP